MDSNTSNLNSLPHENIKKLAEQFFCLFSPSELSHTQFSDDAKKNRNSHKNIKPRKKYKTLLDSL